MYGVRADLLATLLGASPEVVRQLHARWRRAGLAETGRLGPGPVWCWLTRAGLDACGLPYAPYRPPLGRLAHVHAVGCVRAALEKWGAWQETGAYWRGERRLRWRAGSAAGRRGHVPDGEVHWPDTSPHYPGEIWCAEIAPWCHRLPGWLVSRQRAGPLPGPMGQACAGRVALVLTRALHPWSGRRATGVRGWPQPSERARPARPRLLGRRPAA